MDSKDNLWSAASRSGLPSGDKDRDGANGDPQPTASSTGDKVAPVFVFPSSSAGGRKMTRRGSLPGLCPTGVEEDDDVSPEVDDNDNDDNQEETKEDPMNDNINDGDAVYGKIYPMPENVTVITGEENETCVLQGIITIIHSLSPSYTHLCALIVLFTCER